MRKIVALFAGAVLSSSANAAVVTLYLSLHESSTGQPSANGFAIYAKVSDGDNAGLFAFGIDLLGTGDAGGPATLTLTNRSPTGVWIADLNDPNYDPGAVYPDKFAGFGTGRGSSAATGVVSGVNDLARDVDLVRVYGIGQQANLKMNDFKPPPDMSTGVPVAYANYAPTANTDQILGNPGNSAGGCGGGVSLIPAGAVRLATGTWTGNIPAIQQSSVNTKASVWKLDHPNGTENEIAQLAFAFRDFATASCIDYVALNGPVKGASQAAGGFINVTGSNNSYVSEVDQLLATSVNTGNAPIQSIGDEAGNIYVMAKLNGTAADIAALLANTTNDVDASDSQFAPLHANYDVAFGAGGFNALFRFPNLAGAKTFNWEFTGHTGVTIDQLAAVPEPSVGLAAMGGLVLAGFRMRKR